MNKRTWLYHQTVPLGAIFHDEAIDQAKKAGWVDSPQKFVEKPIIKENIIATSVPDNPTGQTGPKPCACGCGTTTMKTWAPGHYSKYQKRLRDGNRKNSLADNRGGTP